MKILFDNGVPKPIVAALSEHEISFARQIGWHELKNGELLQKAEEAAYDLFITTDKNLRYQQSLTGRKIALSLAINNGRMSACISTELPLPFMR